MYTTKQFIILAVVVALIFTSFGFWFRGIFIPNSKTTRQSICDQQQRNLEPGLKAAYQRLIQRGQALIAVRGYGFKESKNIGGQIKKIEKNIIVLRVDPVNALADPQLDIRNILISKNTKIYKQVEKSSEEREKDIKIFDQKMKKFSADIQNKNIIPPLPPNPFKKIEIKLSDLQVGDKIIVNAYQDIHNQKEFCALEIVLQK